MILRPSPLQSWTLQSSTVAVRRSPPLADGLFFFRAVYALAVLAILLVALSLVLLPVAAVMVIALVIDFTLAGIGLIGAALVESVEDRRELAGDRRFERTAAE